MVEDDYYIYLKRPNEKILIMTLYIDDILMASNDLEMIVATNGWLTSNFDMKDMAEVSYLRRVKIHRIDLRGFLVYPKRRT